MKTQRKTLEPLAQSALLVVYELASHEQPAHVGSVAAELGISRTEAAALLRTLEAAGLLWAERCRLSMQGLAVAIRLWSQRARARRRAA